MSDEPVHKQEFAIRGLSTRTLTLYPTRAEVYRDINDVTLKPGANEIPICGLTPTADENRQPGKIRRYLSSGSEDEVSEDEEENEYKPQEESPETRALTKELAEVDESIEKADKARESAISQLSMLNKYTHTLEKDRPANLEACITAYREERKKTADLEFFHDEEIFKLRKRRDSLTKKFDKAIKFTYKQNLKAIKEKVKQSEKKEAAARERATAKQRLKEERTEF